MLCAPTDKTPIPAGVTSNVADMTAPDEPSDNYTGHVDPGTAARRTLPGVTILKTSVGPMDNNAYLVTCSATGETLLIDAANDADVLIDLIRRLRPESVADRDQPSALRPLAGAGSGGRGHRRADRRARDRRRTAAGQTGPFAGQRRHRADRRADVRRHPPARAHPRIDRAGPRRPRDRRRHAVVHRRLPVPGRRRQDLAAGRLRPSCSTTSPPGCSTCTRTPPSSIPATATTRCWAPNAPTSSEWRERGW